MKVVFLYLIFSVNLANAGTPLFQAIEEGDAKKVKELVANGVDVNEMDRYWATVLIRAIENNKLEIVKILLEAGADPNKQNQSSGEMPLDYAIEKVRYLNKDSGIIEELLKHGARVGVIPLSRALRYGLSKTVGDLLEYFDDVKEKDGFVDMALIEASTYEVAKKLLEAGANLNAVDYYGKTALINALKNRHYKKAEKLIELGADVNAADKNGKTGLMYVIENLYYYNSEYSEIIEKLISAGANVNATDQKGNTASKYLTELIVSRYYNSDSEQAIKTIEILFKNGAELDAKDKDANTRLLLFVLRNKYFEPVEKLIELGADVNAKDKDGNTVLFYASRSENVEAVEKIIKAGANVNALIGNPVLDEVLKAGNLEIVRILIQANARNVPHIAVDRDAIDNLALALFSYSGNAKAIGKLIALGANVNFSTPYYGITPLMYASKYGNLEAVKKLIELGANVNAKNNNGETALHYAFINTHYAVIEALLKAGATADLVKLGEFLFRAGHRSQDEPTKPIDVKLINLFEQLRDHLKTTKHVGSQQAGKALAGKCEGSF